MSQYAQDAQVWPLNELNEIVLYEGKGSKNVTGFVPSTQIPLDPITGAVRAVYAHTQNPSGIDALPAKTNRVVKQFTDLFGVSITTSNASVVSTIDPASPFGCPALKLVITFATTAGRVEVTPPALNIPTFNGHVGYTLWLDDATKVGEYSIFTGTSAFAKYQQAKTVAFNGGDLVAGPRVAFSGPMRRNNITDGGFVFGVDNLQSSKLRISAPDPIGGTCTVWVKDCFIPSPQKPIICFTWDDGFDSWVTKVKPMLDKYDLKGTFAINTDQIDKGVTGITSAKVQALIAGGHHIASHNIYNYRLQMLFGTGLGEQNGTGTSQNVSSYVADYHAGRVILESLGAPPDGFMYHPWVQGGMDQAGAEAIKAAGCDIIRTTNPYEAQVYGCEQWNNALAIRSVNLDSTRTLAQAKSMIDDAVAYGGLCVFMGHETADTAGPTTWIESDLAALIDYAASKSGVADILTAKQVRDRLLAMNLLRSRDSANSPAPVRCIGRLIGANMNVTTDQVITLDAGQFKIEGVYVTKSSVSLTTAAGGVYTVASKGGTAVVAASQSYSTLVAATNVLPCTMAAMPTVSSGSLYLSLTTAQGVAATADVFVFGRPV